MNIQHVWIRVTGKCQQLISLDSYALNVKAMIIIIIIMLDMYSIRAEWPPNVTVNNNVHSFTICFCVTLYINQRVFASQIFTSYRHMQQSTTTTTTVSGSSASFLRST